MARQRETWTLAGLLAELEAAGTAQNRKIYRNHGVTGELFGVSYANLKSLHKRVGCDHELALGLWATGIHDARVFACWIADSEATTQKLLEAWAREVDNHAIANELASLVQDTRHARKLALRWVAMRSEWRSVLGWRVFGRLVLQPARPVSDGGLEEAQLGPLLERLETHIHGSGNFARHSMNQALIALGCRPGWMRPALAAAKRIGKVEVDYGKTSCKVTDAASKIKKTVEHYKQRGKSPIDGTAGQRRRHC